MDQMVLTKTAIFKAFTEESTTNLIFATNLLSEIIITCGKVEEFYYNSDY